MIYAPSFVIVEIELADSVASALFRLNNLDGIGPARYAEIDQLEVAIIVGFKNVE